LREGGERKSGENGCFLLKVPLQKKKKKTRKRKRKKKQKTLSIGERATLRCPCCRAIVSKNAWHSGDKFCGLGLGGGSLLWQPAEAALEKVQGKDFQFSSSFSFSKREKKNAKRHSGFFSFSFSFSCTPKTKHQDDSPIESRIKLDTALDLKGNFLFGESEKERQKE